MNNKEFDFSTMICFLLNATSNTMIREYRPQLEKYKLTYPQYLVMMTLWNDDNILIKEISKQTFFDSGTLTPILKRLEEKKYIERVASKEDERSKFIKLTSQGIELKNKTKDIFRDMECILELTTQEQKEISRICNKMMVKLAENKK